MASLTGVGDNVALSVPARGEDILISISGTYTMDIELQKKVGDGAYRTLRTYDTINDTVADYYTTQDFGEVLRVIVTDDTSGTAVTTIADASDKLLHEFDGIGINPAPLQVYQSGIAISGTKVAATAAEINAVADVSARLINIGDVDTYAVLAANSGKPHVIPLVTGNIAIALPTPAIGLEYTFMMVGTADDGDDWIFTVTNDFIGGVVHLDTDGELNDSIAADGSSKNTFTVIVPGAGTMFTMICDGTDWLISGTVASATVPTFSEV